MSSFVPIIRGGGVGGTIVLYDEDFQTDFAKSEKIQYKHVGSDNKIMSLKGGEIHLSSTSTSSKQTAR